MRSRYGAGVYGVVWFASVFFFVSAARCLCHLGLLIIQKNICIYEHFYRMQTAKGNISSRRNINKILLEY